MWSFIMVRHYLENIDDQCRGPNVMEKDHLAGLNQLHWETWKRKQFFFIILKTKSCTKTTIEPEINITIINHPHPAIPWIPLRREGRPAPSLICKLSLTTTISSWWSTTALSSPRSSHSSLGLGRWAMSPLSFGNVFLFDVCELGTLRHFFFVILGIRLGSGECKFCI